MPRTLSHPRPKMGAHLARLRKEAQLSQTDLAEIVGVHQQSIAYWEAGTKPPRSDVLLDYAEALGVTIETLLTCEKKPRRKGGPVGKVKIAFEQVAKLPRRQQEKIVEIVNALVTQYEAGSNGSG